VFLPLALLSWSPRATAASVQNIAARWCNRGLRAAESVLRYWLPPSVHRYSVRNLAGGGLLTVFGYAGLVMARCRAPCFPQ